MRSLVLLFICLLLSQLLYWIQSRLVHKVVLAQDTVLHVPADYATISAALAAAVEGDTVIVALGIYTDTGLHIPIGVRLVGAGWQGSIIDGVAVQMSQGSSIEGFTVQNSSYNYDVQVTEGNSTIQNVRVTGNGIGLSVACQNPLRCTDIDIQGLIADHNQTGISLTNHTPDDSSISLTIRNATIVSNTNAGISCFDCKQTNIQDSIIAFNSGSAIGGNADNFALQNIILWENTYTPQKSDINVRFVDSLFKDVDAADYGLRASSPAIGQGVKTDTDLGALSFIPVGTSPQQFSIESLDKQQWQVSWEEGESGGYMIHVGIKPNEYLFHIDSQKPNRYLLNDLPGGITCVCQMKSDPDDH